MPSDTEQRDRWNARHARASLPPVPAVLRENAHLLPSTGRALDLACGLGAGALFLAEAGLQVSAWDRSPVAIQRLKQEADRRGLMLDARVRDLSVQPPEPESFQVILVAHFLDRTLVPAILQALKPKGLLFYQTFTREAVSSLGPTDPHYRLAPNELLQLFSGLHLRFYREEGRLGDVRRGCRDLALFIGERR